MIPSCEIHAFIYLRASTYDKMNPTADIQKLPRHFIPSDFTLTTWDELKPHFEQLISREINNKQSLEKWLQGFLFPLTEKAYNALTINGHFGLYISDYTGVSFTKEMFKYINENLKGFKYQGDIHYWTPENKKVVRTIFFWKKIS